MIFVLNLQRINFFCEIDYNRYEGECVVHEIYLYVTIIYQQCSSYAQIKLKLFNFWIIESVKIYCIGINPTLSSWYDTASVI